MKRFSNCCGDEITGTPCVCPTCKEHCAMDFYLGGSPLPLTYSALDWEGRNGVESDPWGAVLIDADGDSVGLVTDEETAQGIIGALHAVAASGGWRLGGGK